MQEGLDEWCGGRQSSIGRFLAGDGALILRATESIMGLCLEYEPNRHLRSVY